MDYTAIGDHVNRAARGEELILQYRARILMTESLFPYQGIDTGGSFSHTGLKFVDSVTVTGKGKGLQISEMKDSQKKEAS